MNRQYCWNVLCLLLAIAAAPWGLTLAQAGPGGGTYYANSPSGGASGTALRKFVDKLPGLGLPGCAVSSPPGVGSCNENNLGNYIPIAAKVTTPVFGPTTATDGVTPIPASDYYEVGLVEYSQKLHSDLPKKTTLRGYRDLSPGFANRSTQYLGPMIIAKRNVPVRVRFKNLLPTGVAGKLFIPTDTSLMGAGRGPAVTTPARPSAIGAAVPAFTNYSGNYTQNRATLHLHGGNSPWISDGTPHQWTAPVNEISTPYQRGASARDVPDMAATNPGELTFYWTNQQSGRLMFYHDHTLGLTRLNVYAGEAAGYLITDPVEESLIDNGTLPNACPGGPPANCEYRYGIPLIVQDKTFVPLNIDKQDALWTKNSKGVANKWGGFGDLWFPHVYEANQDPTSPAGANPFGRWDYGPWFWPPVSIAADKQTLPEPSTTPEGFHDTMLVNGAAYPYLMVEPKPYRFRILNASNDRMLNLSLFIADPNDPSGKEVKMVPAGPNPSFPPGWPTDGRDGGVPDPATVGPNLIQIGNESGLLPNPVVHPNQPVNYNYNRRDIVVLNVQEKNLFLGTAERADVIIDFSDPKYIGKNIILYNDAPAPVPASDVRLDYYTGNPDQTASGGAPSTLRGFGPNTRTVLQFRVAGVSAPNPALLATLGSALPAAFKASQPAPLIPEPSYPVAAWNAAVTPALQIAAASEQYAKIQDYAMTLKPLNRDYSQSPIPVTIPFQPKAIQELWDPYGRMNATLGIELPFTTQLNQTTIPMGYAEPVTERIVDGHSQIWKVTHNGVDTHPVHFHMFDVQVVNRVGWDGAIRIPDENELGWKETVRMNPLEDIIVALRPKNQSLPFTLTNSVRLIDPSLSEGAPIAATDIGNLGQGGTPVAAVATSVPNAMTDYGYEYVWHCHILGHEENDFMRPVVFTTSSAPPADPTGLTVSKGGDPVVGLVNYVASYVNPEINQVVLQWVDAAPVTTPSRFQVLRASGAGPYAYPADFTTLAEISYLPGYPPIYTDTNVNSATTYGYAVISLNDFETLDHKSNPALSAQVTTAAWANASGVTLTDSKPVGHVVGTNAQFTASGSGATSGDPALAVAYQYRFLLNGVEVQAFSNNNLWTLADTTPVGSYTIRVEARTSPGQNLVASSTLTHAVNNPPDPPVTIAIPVPAVYSAASVSVSLTAATNLVPPVTTPPTPAVTIFYTTDGNLPTTASLIYFTPIVVTKTTNIQYFAVDSNGTAEAVHSDTWYIHVPDLVATSTINNGATLTNSLAVNLALSAFDPTGVDTMQFSNDGLAWPLTEEPYATRKAWTLANGSDGQRTVYIRFRDKSLPIGVQYPPITAAITLDTTPPVTSPSPVPGNYMNGSNLSVTLTASEAATIYYTADGTTPTTGSLVYATPIQVNTAAGSTTTIKYFAIDSAGNLETVKTGVWSMATIDLTASAQINGGATWTSSPEVTLNLRASDPSGIASYGLSNDGVTWAGPFSSPDTSAGAVLTLTPSWTLTSGEGSKTVYIRFTDTNLGGGTTYPPITASILFGNKDGLLPGSASYLASALKALQIASGYVAPTPMDLVHGDVAPYSGGAAHPDGKIDLLDVYTIMLRSVGLISTF